MFAGLTLCFVGGAGAIGRLMYIIYEDSCKEPVFVRKLGQKGASHEH